MRRHQQRKLQTTHKINQSGVDGGLMEPVYGGILAVGFVVGFIMLVKGADIFIDGAASIATRRGVSEHLIGLTLVAFATSIPELAVSDIAAVQGVEGIAIGNVVGSNIANIGLVLGVAIFIMPVKAPKQSFFDGLLLLAITCLLAGVVYIDGELGRMDGILFLIIYAGFTYYLISNHMKCHPKDGNVPEDVECPVPIPASEVKGLITVDPTDPAAIRKDWIMVVAGALMVLLGANFLVESAVRIAEEMNISEFIIGLTVVSIGTSLPELASSVTAAMKQKHGISVGNVIGSNIINILLVLGSAAAISPIRAEGDALDQSMPFLFLFTILCVILVKTRMPKFMGIVLVAIYVLFIAVLAFGGGI